MAHYETERSFKEHYLYHQDDINLRFPVHLHNSFEFITVINGTLELTIEDKKFILNKGDCSIILPNETHSYFTSDFSETYLCVFSSDFAPDFFYDTKDLYAKNPIFQLNNQEKIIKNIKNPSNIYGLKCVFYYLFSIFYQNTELLKSSKKDNDLMHKILSYIEEHYEEDLTLKNLAEEMGYTYNYLSSLFNESFSIDFPQILNECRIHHACQLLKDPEMTISKTAISCGYNSLRSFNRNFLKIKKMSPSKWRETYYSI